MRWLIATIALLFSSLGLAQDVTVLQINAKWNKSNTVEELRNLDNCEYVFGWLENQPYEIQSKIQAIDTGQLIQANKAATRRSDRKKKLTS